MKNGKSKLVFLSSFVMLLVFMLSSMSAFAEGAGTWVTVAPMTDARSEHAVAVLNGKIYAIGGYSGTQVLNTVQEYDPITNIWTTKASMFGKRYEHQVAVVNGKIYALGGYAGAGIILNTVEEYDSATNTWIAKAAMFDKRSDFQTAVVDGKIYAIGGNDGTQVLNTVEEYDPATNTWTAKAPMTNKRIGYQIALVNGRIYVIGGSDGRQTLNTVEEYDPATDKWTTKAPMSSKRSGHGVAVINGRIYAIGGAYLNTVEEYDPTTNIWTSKDSMINKRTWYQKAAVNGKVYAIGGWDGTQYFNTVEEYDPATNTWTTKAPMSNKRSLHQVAVVNGVIYVIGGQNGNQVMNSVEAYTPEPTPAAPTNLTATSGNSQVDLSWSSTTGAAIYNIKRATTPGGIYTTIATTSAITYTDTAVTNGTTYYYVVSAVNASADEGANSNEVSATPTAPVEPTPAAPTNLTATPGNSKVDLSWSSTTGAAIYNIKRATTPGGIYTTIATTSAITYTDTAVTNGTTYYYVVSAVNTSADEGTNSNQVSATPIAPVEPTPAAPTNLTATPGISKVDLSWSSTTGEAIYNIQRSTTPGGIYTTIATTSALTYTDTAVTNGTIYYYVVSAVNKSGGEGANSNEVSAKPIKPDITLDISSVDKAKIGDEIIASIVIHNATNICAEDIRIAYDTTRLEYLGAENADGMKLYKEDNTTTGAIRYITACLGKLNAANGDKVLLKLRFRAKAVGEAKIDIVKGRIADNATLEVDVNEANCGEKTVLIEAVKDVNRTGEFTLLDLGIDAWYYGESASATDMTKYDTDVVVNGTIDDADLSEIVTQMLKNKNYIASTQG